MPAGRIIEIYGPESSGKTSLALCVLAEAQRVGDTVAMIDAEHAFDQQYARDLGLDVDNVVFAGNNVETGEDAFEVQHHILRCMQQASNFTCTSACHLSALAYAPRAD